jgi:peptide-N4-(N-acetyl-beta-glucosaminyl)asparagine amidase
MIYLLQERLSVECRAELTQRRLADCLEMLVPRSAGAGEMVGRQTGSLAWRLARGELGEPPAASYTFTPSTKDVERGLFCVEFYVNLNYYLVGCGGRIEGWKEGVLEANNVTRVVENDWNMVYLSRTEGSPGKGSVTWKLKLPAGFEAGHVELLINSTVFKTGSVVWQLCGENSCLLPQPGVNLQTDQLTGSGELKLTAMMSGGEGDMAWQHTQLFRSRSSGEDDLTPNFRLLVKIKPV